jgi:lysophospholipase
LDERPPLVGIPGTPVPEGAAAEWVAGAGGVRLRAALFPATGLSRGSVVVSGGRTETIEKYFEVVEELRARGFCVLVHDWRGQGLSDRLLPDRLKGHARNPQEFLDDYAALLDAFEARLPKPWIALGHSMGGCLTLLALAEHWKPFAGAVLSGPMLGLRTPPVPAWIAPRVAGLMKRLGAGEAYAADQRASPITAPFAANILTHDRARYARNQAQLAACPDLALGGPTWGWLDFAFAAIAMAAHGDGVLRIEIPVVAVAPGNDRLVDIAAERRVIARLPKGRFVEVPGALHELLQEIDDLRAVFWAEFDALAAEVAPSSPPA